MPGPISEPSIDGLIVLVVICWLVPPWPLLLWLLLPVAALEAVISQLFVPLLLSAVVAVRSCAVAPSVEVSKVRSHPHLLL